eukprot:g45175.t1
MASLVKPCVSFQDPLPSSSTLASPSSSPPSPSSSSSSSSLLAGERVATFPKFRRLWTRPKLIKEESRQHNNYDLPTMEPWELFTDVLMIGACANLSETLRDELSWSNFCQYMLLAFLFQNGWALYVDFTTRFSTASLLCSAIYFVYVLGTVIMVVHTCKDIFPKAIRSFSLGLLAQRLALMGMYLHVAVCNPAARTHTKMALCFLAVSTLACAATAKVVENDPHAVEETWVAWFFILIVEMLLYPLARSYMDGSMVESDLEGLEERFSGYTMIVLGECAVFSVINYKKLQPNTDTRHYFTALCLCFVLVFGLGLLAFNLRLDLGHFAHGQQRNEPFTLVLLTGHAFYVALLTLGAGMKLVMAAVLAQQPLDQSASWLVWGSLSCCALCLLQERLFYLRQTDPSCLLVVWKSVFLGACLVPLLLAKLLSRPFATSHTSHGTEGEGVLYVSDPMQVAAAGAGWALLLVLAEHGLAHVIYLKRHHEEPGHPPPDRWGSERAGMLKSFADVDTVRSRTEPANSNEYARGSKASQEAQGVREEEKEGFFFFFKFVRKFKVVGSEEQLGAFAPTIAVFLTEKDRTPLKARVQEIRNSVAWEPNTARGVAGSAEAVLEVLRESARGLGVPESGGRGLHCVIPLGIQKGTLSAVMDPVTHLQRLPSPWHCLVRHEWPYARPWFEGEEAQVLLMGYTLILLDSIEAAACGRSSHPSIYKMVFELKRTLAALRDEPEAGALRGHGPVPALQPHLLEKHARLSAGAIWGGGSPQKDFAAHLKAWPRLKKRRPFR